MSNLFPWREPRDKSPHRTRYTSYAYLTGQLKSRPGDWAMVKERAGSRATVQYLRNRLGPEYEVVSERDPEGGFNIFARYVGPDKAEE